MITKKLFIVLIFNNLLFHTLISQTLIQRIKDSYNTLDSVSYIEDIILSYKEDLIIRQIVTDLEELEFRPTYHHLGLIQRHKIIDSLMKEISFSSKTLIEENFNDFITTVNAIPIHFVLNLKFEKNGYTDQHSFFQPDTSKLLFNLISFDKRNKPQFYVFVVWGKFVEYHYDVFPTFYRRAGKNVLKIFKKILRKNPEYLLNCDNLEGGNTIWYVLNDEIYVYRIMQMKKYKLDDYVEKFLLSKNDK